MYGFGCPIYMMEYAIKGCIFWLRKLRAMQYGLNRILVRFVELVIQKIAIALNIIIMYTCSEVNMAIIPLLDFHRQ